MSTRALIGVISFAVTMNCMYAANMLGYMMIGEINRRRQDDDQVSYFGFWFQKILRILGEYRELYPDGRLHVYFLSASALGMVGLLVVAVCVGIIG